MHDAKQASVNGLHGHDIGHGQAGNDSNQDGQQGLDERDDTNVDDNVGQQAVDQSQNVAEQGDHDSEEAADQGEERDENSLQETLCSCN